RAIAGKDVARAARDGAVAAVEAAVLLDPGAEQHAGGAVLAADLLALLGAGAVDGAGAVALAGDLAALGQRAGHRAVGVLAARLARPGLRDALHLTVAGVTRLGARAVTGRGALGRRVRRGLLRRGVGRRTITAAGVRPSLPRRTAAVSRLAGATGAAAAGRGAGARAPAPAPAVLVEAIAVEGQAAGGDREGGQRQEGQAPGAGATSFARRRAGARSYPRPSSHGAQPVRSTCHSHRAVARRPRPGSRRLASGASPAGSSPPGRWRRGVRRRHSAGPGAPPGQK